MIRVLVADDQPLLRSGFRTLLEAERDIEVVAEAADGLRALALARAHRPHIVLTDIRMPGADGIEVARGIAADAELNGVGVIMLTGYGRPEHVFEALRAGAAGFLLKDSHAEDVRHAVRVVAAGEAVLAPAVTRTVIDQMLTQPLDILETERLGELTARERETVCLVARGLSTDQIAASMVISPLTAKTHIKRAKSKLRARDRAHLVFLAYECGLVAPQGR
ncbi:Response regulator protein VraR [Streptomyces sp. YIM 130001]|uniref:response regulator transcription factor n=1 Tax=Streptomyces sp. YIM 130001 TaxID=2259644 RepID=UPI000E65BAA4|nr:response regulator transcription factor [Streptomyces sp. YIM 130001]RII13463.1 Response regulator protein VraR [Streptomyces sp. YIM 130001]